MRLRDRERADEPITDLDDAPLWVEVVEGPAAKNVPGLNVGNDEPDERRRVSESPRNLVSAKGRNVVRLIQLAVGKGGCKPP